MNRRNAFLAWIVLTAPQSEHEKLIPAEKNLDPAWVRSLAERGEPAWWKGEELRWIGMPVGGLCAGQLYLGGDGKLWHWDVFNKPFRTGDGHYRNPMKPSSPFEQGFALRVRTGGKELVRTLDRNGFADIRFRGAYPLGLMVSGVRGDRTAIWEEK